jgi:hypothetical protein
MAKKRACIVSQMISFFVKKGEKSLSILSPKQPMELEQQHLEAMLHSIETR